MCKLKGNDLEAIFLFYFIHFINGTGYICTRYTYSTQDISVPGKEIAPRIFLYQV